MELAKSDCYGSAYYPDSPSGGSSKTRYTSLAQYLSNSYWADQKYLSAEIKDPKNDATYYYGYDRGPNTGLRASSCPDTSSGVTITGYPNFTLSATLERTADQGGLESYQRCGGGTASAKPGLPTSGDDASYIAGKYYVCNN